MIAQREISDREVPQLRTGRDMQTPLTLAAGLLVVLVAQFALDSFADSTQLGHWIQHGLLFAGGVAVGVSLVQLRLSTAHRLA